MFYIMRKRFFVLLAAVFLALPLVESCSIKEDRMPCPTYITVRSTEPLPAGSTAVVTVRHEVYGLELQAAVPADQLYPDGYEVKTHRGVSAISVLAGLRAMDIFSGVATIRDSRQSDSLYRFSGEVESWDEEGEFVREPLKEFTTLTVRVNNADVPSFFRVQGLWDRLDAETFVPQKGNLSFAVSSDFRVGERWSCRLSRQGDESLYLKVFRESEPDREWRNIPLGRYMTLAGYDRNAVPMQDVTIDVDLTEGIVSVQIGDWEKVDFNIYII